MSTKTEHLALHQWAPSDDFSRAEINENFAKVDEGVGLLLESSCVAGSYVPTPGTELNISVGFRPKFAVLMGGNAYAALVMDGKCFCISWVGGNNTSMFNGTVTITDTGFHVNANDSCCNVNHLGTVYYVAFR